MWQEKMFHSFQTNDLCLLSPLSSFSSFPLPYVQAQYQRSSVPLSFQFRIEHTLPFLRSQSAMQFSPFTHLINTSVLPFLNGLDQHVPTTKRLFDPWTMLEDFPDASIPPALLGGVKFERTGEYAEFTYGRHKRTRF